MFPLKINKYNLVTRPHFVQCTSLLCVTPPRLPTQIIHWRSKGIKMLSFCMFPKSCSSEKLTAHRQNKSQIQSAHLAVARKSQLLVLLFLCPPWTVISRLSSHYTKTEARSKSSVILSYRLKWYFLFSECHSVSNLEYLGSLLVLYDLGHVPSHPGDSFPTLFRL